MTMSHPFLSVVFVVAAALLCFFPSTSMGAATYKVGGRAGWDGEPTDFQYQPWSLSKNFYVGDTIRFEYDVVLDNVVEVRMKDFILCNQPSVPVAVYASGNDSITFNEEGCYYYISGHRPHCLDGQKVAFFVQSKGVQRKDRASSISCYPSHSLSSKTHANDSFKRCWGMFLFIMITIPAHFFLGILLLLVIACIIGGTAGCIGRCIAVGSLKPESVTLLPIRRIRCNLKV